MSKLERSYAFFERETYQIKVKIGKTSRPIAKRLAELQTGNSKNLKLIGSTTELTEDELHERYKDKKSGTGGNEWYTLYLEDIIDLVREMDKLDKVEEGIKTRSGASTAPSVTASSSSSSVNLTVNGVQITIPGQVATPVPTSYTIPIPDPPKYTENITECQYKLQAGKRKGQLCGIKSISGTSYCSDHPSGMTKKAFEKMSEKESESEESEEIEVEKGRKKETSKKRMTIRNKRK